MSSIISDSYLERLAFIDLVSRGKVPGHSLVDKFGQNFEITSSSDPEDVVEFGGLMVYDADGTAPIAYVSSSNNSDTQTIKVYGADIDGNEVSQLVTLTGQTNVTLSTALFRVYRIEASMNTTECEGTVYVHTDASPTAGVPATANIRAIVDGTKNPLARANQTLMAVYTIPAGKVGFLYRGEVGIALDGNAAALAEFAVVHYRLRKYGQVFATKKELTLQVGGSSIFQDEKAFPEIIPARSDLRTTVIEVSADMGVWATFNVMLVDEKYIPDTKLAAIGQPGY